MISRPAERSATPGVVCTVWRMGCEQQLEFDKMLEAKDEQIKSLLKKIQRLEVGHTHLQQLSHHCSTSSNTFHQGAATNLRRMGKASPVDQFPLLA